MICFRSDLPFPSEMNFVVLLLREMGKKGEKKTKSELRLPPGVLRENKSICIIWSLFLVGLLSLGSKLLITCVKNVIFLVSQELIVCLFIVKGQTFHIFR